uniref:protein-tyrosine-phosphatase n=1 Tax=Timema californicum TaxID=61474 RepID=A0A7R9P4N1_TIMCA|nr:unnamed protein product [Timema californicum]
MIGPMDNTVCDFWRMIWEQHLELILMLTNLEEYSKTKCAKYWPDDSEGEKFFGDFTVAHVEEKRYSDYIIRELKLCRACRNGKEMEQRRIVQYHFLVWKDFMAPEHPAGILKFIKRVNEAYSLEKGPILVHCSAGVGRTGTLVALDSLLQQLSEEGQVSIFNTVCDLRHQRNFLVQSLLQKQQTAPPKAKDYPGQGQRGGGTRGKGRKEKRENGMTRWSEQLSGLTLGGACRTLLQSIKFFGMSRSVLVMCVPALLEVRRVSDSLFSSPAWCYTVKLHSWSKWDHLFNLDLLIFIDPDQTTAVHFHDQFSIKVQKQYIFIYRALMESALFGNTEIKVSELKMYIDKLKKRENGRERCKMEDDFEKIKRVVEANKSCSVGDGEENKPKNRCDLVIPYDRNRVILTPIPGREHSTYINASFIEGYDNSESFIITQDPLESTIEDFWRMVSEQNITTLVMLSDLGDGAKKCLRYWPDDEASYNHIHVKYIQSDCCPYYTRRELNVTNKKTDENLLVTQFQYNGWPTVEGEVPEVTRGLIELVDQTQNHQESIDGSGPITVHCSCGSDRSSIFVALSILVQQLHTEKRVDIFTTTRKLHSQRQGMLQTFLKVRWKGTREKAIISPWCGPKQVIPIERLRYVGEDRANIFGLRLPCGQHNEPSSLLSQFSRLKRYLFIQVAPHLSSRDPLLRRQNWKHWESNLRHRDLKSINLTTISQRLLGINYLLISALQSSYIVKSRERVLPTSYQSNKPLPWSNMCSNLFRAFDYRPPNVPLVVFCSALRSTVYLPLPSSIAFAKNYIVQIRFCVPSVTIGGYLVFVAVVAACVSASMSEMSVEVYSMSEPVSFCVERSGAAISLSPEKGRLVAMC